MKEDYLWDKTGEDEGIAQLENALAAFRYQETAPPELPQKVFTLEKSPRKSFFRFVFPAFAAFASVLVILSVAWFQLSSDKTPLVEIVGKTDVVNRAQKTAGDSFIAPREPVAPVAPVIAINPPEDRKSFTVPKIFKARQLNAPAARRRENVAARSKKFVEPEEPLTKEEQYAYDQLMLALTITGSKLKIVQDTINGIEEQSVVSGR